MNDSDSVFRRLKIACLQAQALTDLKSKQSPVVKLAAKIAAGRKTVKNKIKRFTKSLFRKKIPKGPRLKILIHLKGGIGDAAMTRIFIKKLRDTLPQAHITFSYDSKKVADLIFGDGTALTDEFINKNNYFPEDYDVVLSGCHALIYKHVDMERVKTLAPDFMPILERGLKMSEIFKVIDDNTPYLDGYLANITVPLGYPRVANLGLSTGLEINHNDKAPLNIDPEKIRPTLKKFGLAEKQYVTVHNGVSDFTNTESGYLTRSWPVKNWREFGKLFKEAYPDIAIVQIGGVKSAKFDFADFCLVGKTELAEVPYILSGGLLHIDGESGMVQLANLLDTISVVLFGPTPIRYFSYNKNINIPSPKCGNCMCIEKRWMTKCVMGLRENEGCMAAITAERVFEAVKNRLG